jgi:hypothetical protein
VSEQPDRDPPDAGARRHQPIQELERKPERRGAEAVAVHGPPAMNELAAGLRNSG